MPPSGYPKKAVTGALAFTKSCYEELLAEVESGKHATYEEAIQFDKALKNLHINEDGKITKK